jgi:predicted DNA binding CopG/RHH family protein
MARNKKLNADDFMNRKIEKTDVVRVEGKVPTRSEAVALHKAKKDARFTARVSKEDFEIFKLISEKKGIGYQTLLGSIIHLYVSGQLVDVEEVRKLLPKMKVKVANH